MHMLVINFNCKLQSYTRFKMQLLVTQITIKIVLPTAGFEILCNFERYRLKLPENDTIVSKHVRV